MKHLTSGFVVFHNSIFLNTLSECLLYSSGSIHSSDWISGSLVSTLAPWLPHWLPRSEWLPSFLRGFPCDSLALSVPRLTQWLTWQRISLQKLWRFGWVVCLCPSNKSL